MLVAWATGDEFVLDDGVERAYLLLLAAEYLRDIGDFDRAQQAVESLERLPEAEPFEAVPMRIDIQLSRGNPTAAWALADEVRRARPEEWTLYEQIGEVFESGGDLVRAERWFTMGVGVVEGLGLPRLVQMMMLTARLRVRAAQGKPRDMQDDVTAALRSEMGLDPIG